MKLEKTIKHLIKMVLNAKKENGDFIMSCCRCWIVILLVMASHGIKFTKDDYAGFKSWIDKIFPGNKKRLRVHVKDMRAQVREIKMFSLPIDQWRTIPCGYTSQVKEKYCNVAELFERLLSASLEMDLTNQKNVSLPSQSSNVEPRPDSTYKSVG